MNGMTFLDMLKLVKLLLTLICCISAAKVNIDVTEDKVPLVFKENDGVGLIPILLTEAVADNQVNITCMLLGNDQSGTSNMTFQPETMKIGSTKASVQARFVSAGRKVVIQCYGTSLNDGDQFDGINSAGLAVSVVVTPGPIVDICHHTVNVDGYSGKEQSFDIKLSEPAVGDAVVIQCKTLPVEGATIPLLKLSFEKTEIPVGESLGNVKFRRISNGAAVHVSCSAENRLCAFAVWENSCQFLYTTSASRSVQFIAKMANIAAFPSSSSLISEGKHVSFLVLDSSLSTEEDLELTCGLSLMGPSTLGQPECGTADNINVNDLQAKLSEKAIVFQPGDFYKNVTVTVSPKGNSTSVKKIIKVSCCASITNPKYANYKLSIFVSFDFYGTTLVNWTTIKEREAIQQTPITYLDTSCLCNLVPDVCDTHCCCDSLCSDVEKSAFQCITGVFGGDLSLHSEHDCADTNPDSEDWMPFMCVYRNNSPFVGYLFSYTNESLAKTFVSFETMRNEVTSHLYSYSEDEKRMSLGISKTGYEQGDLLRSLKGVLTMPGRSINGECFELGIPFVKDSVSSCVFPATEQLCSKPSFNALSYFLSDRATNRLCSNDMRLLSSGDNTAYTPVDVEYYCLTDISNYVTYSSDALNRLENTLSQGKDLFNKSSKIEEITPERCSFDDTSSQPPSPNFDSSSSECSNAVLDVNYHFSWNGGEVKSALAKVTLGNFVAMTTIEAVQTYSYHKISTITPSSSLVTKSSILNSVSPSSTPILSPVYETEWFTTTIKTAVAVQPTIAQRFTVSFNHISISTSVNSLNETITSTLSLVTTQKSGNPGYVDEKPILTKISNETNLTSTDGLKVWQPDSTGLCSNARLNPVTFGSDIFSGCSLRLSLDRFENCTSLKEMVREFQDKLVQSTLVGRRGNAAGNVSDDWIPIYIDEATTTTNMTNSTGNLSNTTDSNSTDNGTNSTKNLTNLIDNLTKLIKNMTNLTGRCSSIPAHLHIEVLIATAGQVNGALQREITGVKVRYRKEDWTFMCQSNEQCEGVNATKIFTLTSTVTFISIPSKQAPVKKKSEIRNHMIDCRFDTCIREVLFPIRENFDMTGTLGLSPRFNQNAVSFALTLILLTCGFLYLSKVWS